MSPSLSVVAHNEGLSGEARETVGDQIRRLQSEAKGLAREHVKALERALANVERIASEISEGGEAYPVGVREIARRLVDDCQTRAHSLDAIASRN